MATLVYSCLGRPEFKEASEVLAVQRKGRNGQQRVWARHMQPELETSFSREACRGLCHLLF